MDWSARKLCIQVLVGESTGEGRRYSRERTEGVKGARMEGRGREGKERTIGREEEWESEKAWRRTQTWWRQLLRTVVDFRSEPYNRLTLLLPPDSGWRRMCRCASSHRRRETPEFARRRKEYNIKSRWYSTDADNPWFTLATVQRGRASLFARV